MVVCHIGQFGWPPSRLLCVPSRNASFGHWQLKLANQLVTVGVRKPRDWLLSVVRLFAASSWPQGLNSCFALHFTEPSGENIGLDLFFSHLHKLKSQLITSACQNWIPLLNFRENSIFVPFQTKPQRFSESPKAKVRTLPNGLQQNHIFHTNLFLPFANGMALCIASPHARAQLQNHHQPLPLARRHGRPL